MTDYLKRPFDIVEHFGVELAEWRHANSAIVDGYQYIYNNQIGHAPKRYEEPHARFWNFLATYRFVSDLAFDYGRGGLLQEDELDNPGAWEMHRAFWYLENLTPPMKFDADKARQEFQSAAENVSLMKQSLQRSCDALSIEEPASNDLKALRVCLKEVIPAMEKLLPELVKDVDALNSACTNRDFVATHVARGDTLENLSDTKRGHLALAFHAAREKSLLTWKANARFLGIDADYRELLSYGSALTLLGQENHGPAHAAQKKLNNLLATIGNRLSLVVALHTYVSEQKEKDWSEPTSGFEADLDAVWKDDRGRLKHDAAIQALEELETQAAIVKTSFMTRLGTTQVPHLDKEYQVALTHIIPRLESYVADLKRSVGWLREEALAASEGAHVREVLVSEEQLNQARETTKPRSKVQGGGEIIYLDQFRKGGKTPS